MLKKKLNTSASYHIPLIKSIDQTQQTNSAFWCWLYADLHWIWILVMHWNQSYKNAIEKQKSAKKRTTKGWKRVSVTKQTKKWGARHLLLNIRLGRGGGLKCAIFSVTFFLNGPYIIKTYNNISVNLIALISINLANMLIT